MPYTHKKIVVFGASQDPSKYGYKIFVSLREQGLDVVGINPKGGEVAGQSFYTSLAEVPGTVDVAVMVIPPAVLVPAVEQCVQAKVSEIWFQPGARNEDAYQLAVSAGIRAVNGCFMADNGFW